MLRYIFIFFASLLVSFVLLPAQSQDKDKNVAPESDPDWTFTQMPHNYQNIQVPRELWQFIKEVLRQDGVKQSLLDSFTVQPISVQVELSAEDKVVLRGGKNHRILFIEGGGELDMFDYLAGKGVFNIRFAPEIDGSLPYHLLYISDSPGRQIEGDMWGNGCGKIYDLTSNSDMFFMDQGIKVTASRHHYLHLMAGTFLFLQLVDERLFLSYILLKDSRYPNFSCTQR